MQGERALIDEVRRWVLDARRIVALTGAGISTDSGIPDYRGPNGVWTKDPEAEKMATLQHYLGDPEVRKRSWRTRLTSPLWDAQPNAGHLALVRLHERGQLAGVVTQNVDGLHQKAGLPAERVIEIHGSAHGVTCWSCGERAPMQRALDRVRAGEEDPPCRSCGGILKSTTISFGQGLDLHDLARAEQLAATCDLFLAVGTTLGVYPAAGLFPTARRAGARTVIVNLEATEYDRVADAVLRRPIAEVLPAVVEPV